MPDQQRLVSRDPIPNSELATTSTDCTQAAKFLLGWDPVPFVFPQTRIECYLDEILWTTTRAIQDALEIERDVARGECPLTVDALRQRVRSDTQQLTFEEVRDA